MGDVEHVPRKICRLKVREFAGIPGLSADSPVSSHSRGATAVARMLCKEIKINTFQQKRMFPRMEKFLTVFFLGVYPKNWDHSQITVC